MSADDYVPQPNFAEECQDLVDQGVLPTLRNRRILIALARSRRRRLSKFLPAQRVPSLAQLLHPQNRSVLVRQIIENKDLIDKNERRERVLRSTPMLRKFKIYTKKQYVVGKLKPLKLISQTEFLFD